MINLEENISIVYSSYADFGEDNIEKWEDEKNLDFKLSGNFYSAMIPDSKSFCAIEKVTFYYNLDEKELICDFEKTEGLALINTNLFMGVHVFPTNLLIKAAFEEDNYDKDFISMKFDRFLKCNELKIYIKDNIMKACHKEIFRRMFTIIKRFAVDEDSYIPHSRLNESSEKEYLKIEVLRNAIRKMAKEKIK